MEQSEPNQSQPEGQSQGQGQFQFQQPPVILVGPSNKIANKDHYARVFPKKSMQILASMHFTNFALVATTQVSEAELEPPASCYFRFIVKTGNV